MTAEDRTGASALRPVGLEIAGFRGWRGAVELDLGAPLSVLIGENATGTSHPRIFKTSEPVLAYDVLIAALKRFERAISKNDLAELQEMLRATVEGYAPSATAQALAPGTDDWEPQSQTLH